MGEEVAIRVGHNLQKDVHLIEDGGEFRVTSKISHNLTIKKQQKDTILSVLQLVVGTGREPQQKNYRC